MDCWQLVSVPQCQTSLVDILYTFRLHFVIKGLIALFSGLVYQKIAKDSKSRYVAVLLGGVIDIVLVAGGYFICEFFLYGSSAAASIPANIIQGVGGLIISFVLYPVLMAIPDVKQLTYKTK